MKISIKNQFMILVSVLVVIAVVTISIFLFSYVNDAVTEKIYLTIDNVITDCVNEMENLLGDVQKLNDSLSVDEYLLEIVSDETTDFFTQRDRLYQLGEEYNKLTYLLLEDKWVRNKCCLLLNEEYPLSKKVSVIKDLNFFKKEKNIFFGKFDEQSILNQMELENITVIPLAGENVGVLLAQKISDNVSFTDKYLGVNLVQVDIGNFFKNRTAILETADVKIAMVYGEDVIYKDSDINLDMFSNISQKDRLVKLPLEGRKEKLGGIYTSDYGFKLIALVDAENIQIEVKNVAVRIFITVMIILLILIFVTKILVEKLTRQIRVLSEKMINFDENTILDEEDKKYNVIEIQQLYDSFGYMNKKIHTLIENAHLQGQKEFELEMKLLQAQVNPHYLYNALDSIAWCALSRQEHDIVDMISALSEGFRYSIKETEKSISVKEEIDFVVGYLHLQELRYRRAITLKIDIDEETKGMLIPKFLIQPLVENSIIHGLGEEIDKITIKLNAKAKDKKLIISISDNGVGTEPDKLNEYLKGNTEIFAEEKIGISNVNKRIKMKFGEEFGLKYKKEYDFLTAEISLPIIENQTLDNF